MKLMRIALTGSLLLFLAACGNDSPVPPPTTTGTTTDGTTTGTTTGLPSTTGGTTTGGTTGVPTTTGGTTTGFPTTGGTTGFPTTGGTTGFPTTGGTTGGTTDGTTTGGSTTGGTTTGGTTTGGGAGTLEGTVTAPDGGDVSGTVVLACYNNNLEFCLDITDEGVFTDGFSNATLVSQSGSTGAYSIGNLQTAQFSLIAFQDVDGNGSLRDDGDYFGIYLTSNPIDVGLVTPPQAGLSIQLFTQAELNSRTASPDSRIAKALHAAESSIDQKALKNFR